MDFHWSPGDSNSFLLLYDSSRYSGQSYCRLDGVDSSPIFNPSNSIINPLGTVPSAPITNYYFTHMFHSFLSSRARSKYLSVFSFHSDSQGLQSLLYSRFLVKIRWSVCISKYRNFVHPIFQDRFWFVYIVWSNFNFLHNFQWVTFPTQSCIACILFCARWQYSFLCD